MTDQVERAAKIIYERGMRYLRLDVPEWTEGGNSLAQDEARAAASEIIAAMRKDAAMDRLVAEGQRCDAMTPQEAAPDWEGFGRAMLEHWPVRDVDGAELFDLSLKHGLIAEVPGGYDPEQHIDAEGISPETGDPWYEYTFREDSQ